MGKNLIIVKVIIFFLILFCLFKDLLIFKFNNKIIVCEGMSDVRFFCDVVIDGNLVKYSNLIW